MASRCRDVVDDAHFRGCQWGLNTVVRDARAAAWQDTLREHGPGPSRLDSYKPYRERRFAAGCTNVTRLYRELITENVPVTYQVVRA